MGPHEIKVKSSYGADAVHLSRSRPALCSQHLARHRSGPMVFQPFLKRLGLTSLKSGSDPKASLMRKLGLTGIPTTLLISPTGKVVGKLEGTAKWDTPSAVELVNFYLRN